MVVLGGTGLGVSPYCVFSLRKLDPQHSENRCLLLEFQYKAARWWISVRHAFVFPMPLLSVQSCGCLQS